ncbi:MAG: hypothetical protein HYT87_19555 [Nitrospirae bacterium]|nr:hypothetical protein [Nitrospirota bacterium]
MAKRRRCTRIVKGVRDTVSLLLVAPFLLLVPRSAWAADGNAHLDVFGNVDLTVADKPKTRGFALGMMDLVLTGSPIPGVRGLAETVLQGEEDGEFEIEIERLSITYDFRDYLSVTAGKIHTPVGYYNTAYHHGRMLESAATRPLTFRFEDQGGILPLHLTGVALNGSADLPGSLRWTYDLGVANGRGTNTNRQQIVGDDNDWKAIAARLTLQPMVVPGLEGGFSTYLDRAPPGVPPEGLGETTHEQLYSAHLAYRETPWELLAEFVTYRRLLEQSRAESWNMGTYAQLAYSIDKVTPYARGEFLDAEKDPYAAQTADLLWSRSVLAGIRFDADANLALKAEGASDNLRGSRDARRLTFQVAFTF